MRFAHLRRVLLVAAVAGGIAAVVLWQARPPRDGSLDEAVGALRRDDAGAAARVRRIARREGAACLPAVQAMLDDPDWRLRAAACAVLGDQADRPSLAPLVSRCSDVDWRVRAAAAEALSRWRPLPARQTLRDVPIDQRDRALLEWMETLDGDDRLSERLCDLYAGARHVEFSRTLADRCLTCHAGPYPRPQTPGGDCGACHGEIHRQWAASAHANSLTHLSLPTPVDGGLAPLDFGDLGGLDCTACHRAAAAEATGGCPYVFDDLSVDAVCQRCHAPTVRQWRRWREGPQPRRAPWPPGHLEVRTGLDRRDCADCHMAPDGGIPAHHWQARRDPALLAGGVALRVAQQPPGPDGAVVRLTLTNLAGHDYPTGSRRRAVHLYAGPVGAELAPLLTLSPEGPGRVHTAASPALAPGEGRDVELTVPADTAEIYYLLVYDRDLDDPEGYTADILSGCYRLSPWPQ